MRVSFFTAGLVLLTSVVLMAMMSWVESRGPRPLALRRRARVLTGAFLVSFFFPSVFVVLSSF